MNRKEKIGNFVGRKINLLQAEADYGAGKALMADLRRGIGHEPGEMPRLFGLILQDMPEEFLSGNGETTEGEWACYLALTLFSLHQQGYEIKSQPMHIDGKRSIGRAMSRLASSYEDANGEQRMLQRLQALATSVNMKEVSHHLRGIVQLLKSKGIPLDYVMLAKDLYELQFPEGKNRVCLRWGQDFYRKEKEEMEESIYG